MSVGKKLIKRRCVNPHPAWGKYEGLVGIKDYDEEIEKIRLASAVEIELTGIEVLSKEEIIKRWNGERE